MSHPGRPFHELKLLRKDMFTRRDFRYNFLLWRVISSVGILRLDVDEKQGILKVPKSPWKCYVSLGFFGLSIIHCCFIHFRLLQVLLDSEEIPRHHLVFHLDMSLVSVILGWYLASCLLYPDIFVALFNDMFPATGGNNGPRASWRSYSRQALLAVAMPMVSVAAVMFVLCVFAYDCTMTFLLYSSLPEDYKTPVWFGVLFCKEILLMTFLGSNASIVLTAQLLFLEKIIASLKALSGSTKLGNMRTERKVQAACHRLRNIQLKVSLFNNVNRFIIFSFKFLCITMCTLNGYYMIAHFSADPLYGCVYVVAFWFLCISYSVMYERAHVIPSMFSEAKSTLLLRVGSKVHAPELKRKMEVNLRSVPAIGIQVGRFHTFEQMATPVFVDFVFGNVMGLLVMHLNT